MALKQSSGYIINVVEKNHDNPSISDLFNKSSGLTELATFLTNSQFYLIMLFSFNRAKTSQGKSLLIILRCNLMGFLLLPYNLVDNVFEDFFTSPCASL